MTLALTWLRVGSMNQRTGLISFLAGCRKSRLNWNFACAVGYSNFIVIVFSVFR